jgi:hypothetical protein
MDTGAMDLMATGGKIKNPKEKGLQKAFFFILK